MKFVIKIVCVIVCFVAFAAVANAQCYPVSYYTYSNTYQYPVREVVVKEVITPVAVPVLVPAFQYQYVSPCAQQQVHAATPVTTPMQSNMPTPNTPAPAQTAVNEQEKVRLLARALLAEMQQQADGDNGPPMAVSNFYSQQQQLQQQQQQPTNAFTVISNRCASCHTGPSSKGGVMIFAGPGQFNSAVDRQRIIRAIEDGRMPPQAVSDPRFRLTPQEVAMIRDGLR